MTTTNTQSSKALEAYQHCAAKLLAQYEPSLLYFQNDLRGFWQQWTKLHAKILNGMLAQFQQSNRLDDATDAQQVEEFLKKRSRLLSVLIQRLQEQKIFDSTRQTFAVLMRQHDENFRHILQSAQTEMRRELKKAFAASTAVKGYAKTSSGG